jgi:RecA/RadA recombinase
LRRYARCILSRPRIKLLIEMETNSGYPDEDFSVIGEVLDTVRSARGQLGTLSHMSEDLEDSVAGLRDWLEKVLLLFSDRRNITLVAASVIITAALINHLRGWVDARFLRNWIYTLDPEITSTGSALNTMARDIMRSRSRGR